MIRLVAISLFSSLLAGCDRLSDEVSRLFWGIESTFTVVSQSPVTLSPMPIRFEFQEPLRVVGSIAQVCASMRGGFPQSSLPDPMKAEFESMMRGASISALVTTTNGKTIALRASLRGWRKHGRIEEKNELAVCVHASQKLQDLPIGTKISRIEVSSSAPLDVRGLYWESSNELDARKKGS